MHRHFFPIFFSTDNSSKVYLTSCKVRFLLLMSKWKNLRVAGSTYENLESMAQKRLRFIQSMGILDIPSNNTAKSLSR